MIEKSKAVVLKSLKYSETSIILTLYTRVAGRQVYMVNGVRSAKSKLKSGLLQPFFLLDIDAYHKPGREMQRLKEFRMSEVLQSIPFNVVKSTMSIFLSEVLYKVLQNEEPDEHLFDFIYHSVQYLDSLEVGIANFHLWFLIRLLGNLGFGVQNNHSPAHPWFDIKTGSFTGLKPVTPDTPNRELSVLVSDFISMDLQQLKEYKLSGGQRTRMLEMIIAYYHFHFDSMGEIRSLEIMKEVFK
jgi:DNA repair protein RecO (recombination protein O)